MRLLFVVVFVLSSLNVLGSTVGSFNFPQISPLEAAVSSTILKGPRGRRVYMGKNIGMELPKSYQGANRFSYRLYRQKRKAPLIFLLPGLGGKSSSGTNGYLAKILFEQGYHVVAY